MKEEKMNQKLKNTFIFNDELYLEAIKHNFARLKYVSIIGIIISFLHVVSFCFLIKVSSTIENTWRVGIMVVHMCIFCLYVIISSVQYYLERKKINSIRIKSIIHHGHTLITLLLAIALVTIDQYVTQSITPFLVLCLGISLIFLLRPLIAIPLFSLIYPIYYYSIGITQSNPAVLASNRVNGVSTILISTVLSYIMWSYFSKDYVQKRIIKSQNRDLERSKKNLERVNEQLELAFYQTQINPHFIFNTLSTISYLCISNPSKASEILDKLAFYLRRNFDFHSFYDRIALRDELRLIEVYLEIQKERYGEKLRYEVNVEEDLLNLEIPTLILQPIIENAIVHGISKKATGGVVSLTGYRRGHEIIFEIADDGPGINEDVISRIYETISDEPISDEPISGEPIDVPPLKRKGIGLKNINSRLHRMYGSGIKIKINEMNGTTVIIEIN